MACTLTSEPTRTEDPDASITMSRTRGSHVAQGDEQQGSESESESGSEGSQQVETLIAGRDRRATAGNRMAHLIQREEEEEQDDEVALLFAQEDEEADMEFEGSDEAASEAQLDSSSDDEDQGPPGGAENDLDGEKELQREAKVQKAKKRKARDAFTTVSGLQKKVKIIPVATTNSPQSRPPKKSERVSWLPDIQDGPRRASARKQTVENKEVTHARLKDHAEKRAKVLAQMRRAEHERDKHRPKQMTQVDRLAEAAETEMRNSKSLNRWEETERKRADEQAAKLAALKTRKLEGPVVSWWSGMATWSGTKLVKIGPKETDQDMLAEPRKRGRKPKQPPDASKLKEEIQSSISTPQDQAATSASCEPSVQPPTTQAEQRADSILDQPSEAAYPTPTITFQQAQGPQDSFLQGIQEYATMPSENGSGRASNCPSEGPGTPDVHLDSSRASAQAQQPPRQSESTHSTRNLVMLTDFESLSPTDRGQFNVFYNPRRAPKLAKVNQQLCPITSLPARFRDPVTGVAYANLHAYRTLKELQGGRYTWSGILGCYVGAAGLVARGVPDAFRSEALAA